MYWISAENGDKYATEITKALECSVPYNRAGGKYGLADKDPLSKRIEVIAGTMKMERKNISRQYLIDKSTNIINAPYTAIDEDFYQSAEWIKTKDEYIKNNPFCELCLSEGKNKQSDDVHHIVRLTAGGEPFSEDNLALQRRLIDF